MTRSRTVLLTPAVLLGATLPLLLPLFANAANGDFAGVWKLDRVEGGDGIPVEIDMELALEGENLSVKRVIRRDGDPERTVSYTYVTNGEPHEVPGIGDTTRNATATWKGKRLKVEYPVNFRGMDFNIVENWKLRKGVLELQYVVPLPDRKLVTKQFYVRP
jgi:hypothetical protein